VPAEPDAAAGVVGQNPTGVDTGVIDHVYHPARSIPESHAIEKK